MADNKIYSTFKVGGDPTKIAFLASDLSDTVNNIQSSGWTIERIDSINNTSAWDFHKQKYVSTTEYIIIAYRNACEESTKEPMKVDPSFENLATDLADKCARVNIVPANEIRQMLGLEEK